MRILVVSNRYPPYYTGGYELNCREAVEGLRRAGHQVRVLTSAWGAPHTLIERLNLNNNPLEIYRTLTPCFDFWLKRHHLLFSRYSLWNDSQAAAYVLRDWQPDLIYVWNMDWSSIAALYHLQGIGVPMVYHFGAPWLNTYAERAIHLRRDPFSRLYRQVAGQTWGWDYRRLRIDAAISMTAFIRRNLAENGWIKPDSILIAHGFDLAEWPLRAFVPFTGVDLRLLYVGRLDPLKGLDSLTEALPALTALYPKLTLTISSTASDSRQASSQTYRAKLEKRARTLGVANHLNFVQTPREDLAALYAAHHILIFPSIWQEPYGLIPLEAMACGTPVVATGTGGSSEYLRDGENALLFEPGNAVALSQTIKQLAGDTSLQQKLVQNGRELVERDYRLETTIARIEKYLNYECH